MYVFLGLDVYCLGIALVAIVGRLCSQAPPYPYGTCQRIHKLSLDKPINSSETVMKQSTRYETSGFDLYLVPGL